ncbi:MAG: 5-oxoprolinase subunit PxpB [Betaproteobacteria bacterium]|nr:5-oxoprolinase subunit PxpB [Betaproteobacteria bacterium]
MSVRFLPAGDTAIVVEFGDGIDRALNERVLRLGALVRDAGLPGVIETLPTFRSLMIHYDPLVTCGENVVAAIGDLLDHGVSGPRQSKLWRIPACYAATHAPDLEDVARRTGLGTGEIIRLHSNTRFQIYMIGFSPGFPYMGDLPQPLVLPRRTDPRVRVPAGSVAIAAGMTSIYPVESPGGWHLIGATPVRLFDLRWPRPALLSPGDAVTFEPIDAREFELIHAAVATDTYVVPCEANNP